MANCAPGTAADCNHGKIRRRIWKNRSTTRARRSAGWPGLSSQPRRHLVGDSRFPERTEGRRAGTRQRHRAARRHLCGTHAATHLVAERYLPVASRQHRGLAKARGACQSARAAAHRPHRSRLVLDGGWASRRRRSRPCSASTCCTSRRGQCRKTSSPAPDVICATAAGCSSTARSCATGSTRRRAMPRSTPACGRKIPLGRARRRRSRHAHAKKAGLTRREIVRDAGQ